MYWVVISIQFSFEEFFGFLVGFLPFFQLFRFLFISWLVLPQTQGASQIYLSHIAPFLVLHESQIDSYVYTAHEKIKALGADYLARLLHYSKEYASHYMMGTEVHPFTYPVPEPVEATSSFTGSPSAAGSSYVDTFFSKFKYPPTYASMDDSTIGATSVGHPSNSSPFLADPSGSGTGSTLWNSVFKAGAAAIQSTLLLPKISPEGSKFASPDKAGFGSILGKLDHQLFTTNASSPTSSAREVSSAATTGLERSENKVKPVSTSNSSPLAQNSSTLSLNSDTDFEFVKYDESVTIADNTEGESMDKNSIATSPRQRSGSWFSWSKNPASPSDDDASTANPVKLD